MWTASYCDGRSRARQLVTLTANSGGLAVVRRGGETIYWPYDQIRRAKSRQARLRLERRGGGKPEILWIDDAGALEAISAYLPAAAKRRRLRGVGVAVASIGLAVIAVSYLWGAFLLTEVMTRLVDRRQEERLGEAAVNYLVPTALRCTDEDLSRSVVRLLGMLATTIPQSPYGYRVVIVDSVAVNAIPAPGGEILVYRGLVARTKSPHELAAVFAHQMQHIVQRHATRALFHKLTPPVLVLLATGPSGGRAERVAKALMGVSFAPEQEEAADLEAVRMLQAAGLDAGAVGRLARTVRELEAESGREPAYFSMHPYREESLAAVEKAAREAQPSVRDLPEARRWTAIALSCGASLR